MTPQDGAPCTCGATQTSSARFGHPHLHWCGGKYAAPPASPAPGAPDIPALIERLRNSRIYWQDKDTYLFGLISQSVDALTALSASHEALKLERDDALRKWDQFKLAHDAAHTRAEAAEAQLAALRQQQEGRK